MNLSNYTTSKLGLYRCNKCRRAFFSVERRKQHILFSHGGKLKNTLIQNQTMQRESVNSQPDILSILTIKKHRYRSKTEAILATILKLWPPINAYKRLRTRHLLSPKRIDSILKRILVTNFSSILHGTKNVEKLLLEEYSKTSRITPQRSENLSLLTGINARYIRLWFYWRRKRGHKSEGEQLLQNTFADEPYLSDEALQMLVNNTGMLISQIRLWFRLMRAKHKMMEFKEVEEKVLWACFLKNPDCSTNSQEVINVSEVVGMEVKDVNTIFKCWQSVWGHTDPVEKEKIFDESKTRCNLLEDSTSASHESILDSLEKARTSQKELGIPTHCKVVEFHAYLKTIDEPFKSYEPTGRRLSCDSDDDDDQSLLTLFGIPDVTKEQLSHDEIQEEDTDVQSNLIDNETYMHRTHSLLKVKSNVLGPATVSSNAQWEEQGLYSLFESAPSESEHDDLEWNDSSNGDSGNESESSDSSEREGIEFVSEVIPFQNIAEVIDLTLDSDLDDGNEPQTSNDEYVSINFDFETPTEIEQHETPDSEASESTETNAIVDSNNCDNAETIFESDEPLVICESDEETGTSISESSDKASTSHVCLSKESSSDSHNTTLTSAASTEKLGINHNINHQPTAAHCSKNSPPASTLKVNVRNSFKTLHARRGAIYTEARSLTKTKVCKLPGKSKRSAKFKGSFANAKSLFNKSLLESRRSAYLEMKKRLLKNKTTPSKQQP